MRKGLFALAAVGLLATGSMAACGDNSDGDSGSAAQQRGLDLARHGVAPQPAGRVEKRIEHRVSPADFHAGLKLPWPCHRLAAMVHECRQDEGERKNLSN